MMQRDMPGTFAALREPADHDALLVDVKALFHGGNRFEDIPFTGPMPAGSVDASEAIELDLSLIGDGRIAAAFAVQDAVDELCFSRRVLTAMQPDVKTRRLG